MAHKSSAVVNKRSALDRPLKPEQTKSPRQRPRVKRFSLSFGPRRRVIVSLRRFTTPKQRRSKRVKQLVFNPKIKIAAVREVAVAWHVKPRKRLQLLRKPKMSLGSQVAASAVLVLLGTSGMVYFSLHLKGPVKLDITNHGRAHADAPSSLNTRKPAQPPDPQPSMLRSNPLRIRIPKISLDTSIIPVGLNSSGAIAMPNIFDVTGWYDKGPTPGQIGPAVIVGHVDSTQGIAIFWRLRELMPGDTVMIDLQDGKTATFKVTDIKQFPQADFPTQQVYGNINYAGIRLITCGGTFSTATHHYSHNTVVFGRLQGSL